jgi:hypothetical protein
MAPRPIAVTVLLAAASAGCLGGPYHGIFPISQGWLGADGAASVAIAPGRSIWFFDDTFAGSTHQTTRPGATFVHNTIGLSTGNPLSGTWDVTYDWPGQGGSNPSAVFATPAAAAAEQWFWPTDAAAIGGQLYVGLEANVATPGQNLGFAGAGVTLATITNPTAPPSSWAIQYDTLSTDPHCYPGAAVTPDATGSALLLYMPCDNPDPSAWQRPVMLLRIPVAGLASPAANLQYLAADGTWQPGLPPSMTAAKIVMPAGHTEYTVRYHPELSEWVAIMILPGPFFTNQIAAFTAPAAEGPWTAPVGVFTYPEMTKGSSAYVDANTFCYAAKEHTEYETPGSGKLVASYACNDDLGTVVSHMNLYVPRLVEIELPH